MKKNLPLFLISYLGIPMQLQINKIDRNKLLFYISAVLVVVISFFTYAPCFFYGFHSDNAIHVLMSVNFTWPHDVYYWGQNRLGSFFPLIASFFIKLFPKIHALYICSFVQYAMLLLPTLVIASFIKSRWLKLLLFFLIFLPMNGFYLLPALGHPYLGQYFCGVFFFYFCYKYQLQIKSDRKDWYAGIYLILAVLFYTLSIWISETSAVFILLPVIMLLPPLKEIRQNYSALLKIFAFVTIFCIIPGIIILLVKTYHMKGKNAEYDALFFFKPEQIAEQLRCLWRHIYGTFTFSDNMLTEDIFYYVFFTLVIWLLWKKRIASGKIVKAFLLTALFAYVLLFFSSWNLKYFMPARYYIPVYLLVAFAILFYLDKMNDRKVHIIFMSPIIILSFVFLFHNASIFVPYPIKGNALKTFSDFRKLPKGTLIADYWAAYLINSVAYKNLHALAYDGQSVRNREIMAKCFTSTRYYFINDDLFRQLFPDNSEISQFGYNFRFTGEKINCNGHELLVYKKSSYTNGKP